MQKAQRGLYNIPTYMTHRGKPQKLHAKERDKIRHCFLHFTAYTPTLYREKQDEIISRFFPQLGDCLLSLITALAFHSDPHLN